MEPQNHRVMEALPAWVGTHARPARFDREARDAEAAGRDGDSSAVHCLPAQVSVLNYALAPENPDGAAAGPHGVRKRKATHSVASPRALISKFSLLKLKLKLKLAARVSRTLPGIARRLWTAAWQARISPTLDAPAGQELGSHQSTTHAARAAETFFRPCG